MREGKGKKDYFFKIKKLGDPRGSMVNRPLHPGKAALKIYIYRRGLLTPPRGWFPWGPLLYRAPPFPRGCPPFRFTLTAHGDQTDRLPWDRHRVGHFLATLIRRVANTSGNFIHSRILPSFHYYWPAPHAPTSPPFCDVSLLFEAAFVPRNDFEV